MILYDKNAKFIGMNINVVHFLGYEDMSKFMMYNNDVADLFIKKSGYIHKFDKFSWIEYVLHGGGPNKKVLLKLRNGNEIESSISIQEIIPADENNESKLYIITLDSILSKQEKMLSLDDKLPEKKAIFGIDEHLTSESAENVEDESENYFIKNVEEEESAIASSDKLIDSSLSIDETKTDENIFGNILDSPEAKDLMKKIFIDDQINDETYNDNKPVMLTTHKSVIPEGSISETKKALNELDLLKIKDEPVSGAITDEHDTVEPKSLHEEKAISFTIEDIQDDDKNIGDNIDTQKIANILGIDKDAAKEYIDEYIIFLKNKTVELKKAVEKKDIDRIKKIVLRLVGIGNNLRTEKINNKLYKIYNAQQGDTLSLLDELEMITLNLKID